MILALKIVIGILLLFTAIGLLCAVGFARSRGPGGRIGRQCPPPVDPFFYPIGEAPTLSTEQRRAIWPRVHPDFSRTPGGAAIPPAAGSGWPSVLSADAAARNSLHIVRRSSDVR